MTEASTNDQLPKLSRLLASDLRRAERSIVLAARDTAQFLVTTLDAIETAGVSPAFAHSTARATIHALTALAESQEQLTIRAHRHAEQAGATLGLTVVDWGEGAPKPRIATIMQQEEA